MSAQRSEKRPRKQNKKEECYICGDLCSSKTIKAHIRTHTEATVHDCEECGARLNTKIAFKKHMKLHKSRYICEICRKKFESLSDFECHDCGSTAERKHLCEICLKSFLSRHDLERHVRIHTNEKPFTCEVCNRRFTQKSNRDSHLRSHYSEELSECFPKEKCFVCEICFQRFGYKHDLARHKAVHMDEKPFLCEICSKRFSQKAYLKIHIRIHNDERPFKCEMCDKSFPRKAILTAHVKHKHMGIRPEKRKNHICDICNKAYYYSCQLKKHYFNHANAKMKKPTLLKISNANADGDIPMQSDVTANQNMNKIVSTYNMESEADSLVTYKQASTVKSGSVTNKDIDTFSYILDVQDTGESEFRQIKICDDAVNRGVYKIKLEHEYNEQSTDIPCDNATNPDIEELNSIVKLET